MALQLGVQLYTLRGPMADDFFGTLEQVAEMGLRCVETAGLGGHSADRVRAELDRLGLTAPAAHVGIDLDSDTGPAMVDEARTLGCSYLVLPWVPEEAYVTGWAGFAARLSEVGRRARAEGLKLLYHNHAFEFGPDISGGVGFDVFFDSVDPEAVGAEVDTHWVQVGGRDPADTIRALAGRTPCVHLKDLAAEGGDIVAGEGVLDWDAILAACAEAGVRYGFIEMDNPPGDPVADVRACVEFFRSKGIVD